MRKRWIALLVVVIMCCSVLGACGSTSDEDGVLIYYMDALGGGLQTESHVLTSTDVVDQVAEVVELLAKDPDSSSYRRTIPESVSVQDILLDDAAVTLYFNRAYSDLSGYTEVLIRAGIVKSLVQIDGVDSVSFYVADAPLSDASGTIIGAMSAESFIDNYGEETDRLEQTTLTLYFSSADGKSLVERTTDVYYNSNVSVERLIIDQLISGIDGDDAISPIPSGTKVVSVTVTNGVCYVTFDSNFLTGSTIATSDVLLYAIVDSLTEESSINKVQILVDGSSGSDATFTFSLGTSYERDLSLLQQTETTEEEGT